MGGGNDDPDWVPPLALVIGKGDNASRVSDGAPKHPKVFVAWRRAPLLPRISLPEDFAFHRIPASETGYVIPEKFAADLPAASSGDRKGNNAKVPSLPCARKAGPPRKL